MLVARVKCSVSSEKFKLSGEDTLNTKLEAIYHCWGRGRGIEGWVKITRRTEPSLIFDGAVGRFRTRALL